MITFREASTNILIKYSVNPLFTEFMEMDLINKDVILAGGSLRHLFNEDELICDFDVFFTNRESAIETGLILEKNDYKIIFKCPLGHLTTYRKEDSKVQLITERTYFGVQDLIDSFDITACRFAYDGTNIHTYYSAIRDVKNKVINLHTITHAAATFKRILKYQTKGYNVSRSCISKYVDTIYQSGINGKELDMRFYID